MLFNVITGVLVAGGPHLSGFWMMPEATSLRVSFDPASNPERLSVSAAYSQSFAVFNDLFVGVGFRGLSVALEGRVARLEGEYSGSASEMAATLGYAHDVFSGFRLGGSFSYYQINTPRPDIPRLQAFGLHLSSSFVVYDRWNVGLFARNVNAPEIGGTPLPTLLGGYISFLPKATIRTSVGLYKDQYSNLNFGLGGSWRLYEILTLRGSMRYDGEFPTFYLGFTLQTARVSSDIMVTAHPELPMSTYIGLNYGH